MRSRRWLELIGIIGIIAAARPARADGVELKIATLAPAGSAWAKIMADGGVAIDQKTAGRVKVKYYFSGAQGDERDVVRKMKLKQLDGAAVTAVGLGMIGPDVRVLELPYLVNDEQQLDHVRGKMQPDFEKQLDAAGYVLLAWGDVGWVHLYSNIPITSKADLQKVKMWVWSDDPIRREFFKRLGVNTVPLGVPEVLTSLQSGAVDACYGSPLAALALQWYTKVKYATEEQIAYTVGALVVRKEVFAKLSPEDQKTVRALGTEMGEKLMKSVRSDNERAVAAMKKAGVQFQPTSPELKEELKKAGMETWDALAGGGKVYSTETLAKAKKLAGEVR
jgi:TRAP-type C4-dicarboxylate transport system substrate-binding protein